VTEEYEALLVEVRALRPGPPPAPWTLRPFLHAGGVVAAGWTRGSQLLLVSASGYSLSDPATGARLIRERDEEVAWAALSPETLSFTEPRTGERVGVFGVWGGDGVHVSADGWAVEPIYPWWPEVDVLLRPPHRGGARGYLEGAARLEHTRGGTTWRGCGFSPSGAHLVLVWSDGAQLYVRPTP